MKRLIKNFIRKASLSKAELEKIVLELTGYSDMQEFFKEFICDEWGIIYSANVEYDIYPGCDGDYWNPPEDPYLHSYKITFDDDTYKEIEQQLTEFFTDDYSDIDQSWFERNNIDNVKEFISNLVKDLINTFDFEKELIEMWNKDDNMVSRIEEYIWDKVEEEAYNDYFSVPYHDYD